MTDVVRDFDALYDTMLEKFGLSFFLSCADRALDRVSLHGLRERQSYFCCAVDAAHRCVLHKCVLVVFGTRLDLRFRRVAAADEDAARGVYGTFMIDGRHLSFPNIMMNNNVLVHNFYDKLYSKSCKRMFLYGNVDEEKQVNRAIQLVYSNVEDALFARDVYARDYVVTGELNKILHVYLKQSGKWEPLNFLFNYTPAQSASLVEQIKKIMRAPINYSIDSLANKIIYKHDYLLGLLYKPFLDAFAASAAASDGGKRKKTQTVMFARECKKIVETVVNGRLIYVVSKTFSKQKKNFINYQDNSSNNNIEIVPPVLKYRIGNEVVRITNETMRQDMLMQKSDFVKFVDSFFHGEMTVAGKKFFLCRNVRLPAVDYQAVADRFAHLETSGLLRRHGDDDDDEAAPDELRVAFNDRPTVYACRRASVREPPRGNDLHQARGEAARREHRVPAHAARVPQFGVAAQRGARRGPRRGERRRDQSHVQVGPILLQEPHEHLQHAARAQADRVADQLEERDARAELHGRGGRRGRAARGQLGGGGAARDAQQ
nr:ORF51 lef-8 [Lymantria dispar multiple nucleopolyhedrovirus]